MVLQRRSLTSVEVSCKQDEERKWRLECSNSQWRGRYKDCATQRDVFVGRDSQDVNSKTSLDGSDTKHWKLPFPIGKQNLLSVGVRDK